MSVLVVIFLYRYTFEEENYLEFSKTTQGYILGTKEETARVIRFKCFCF